MPTRKLVLAPDDGAGPRIVDEDAVPRAEPAAGDLDADVDRDGRQTPAPAASLGQAVRRPDGYDVALSGLSHPAGADLEAQLRGVVSTIRELICDGLGGELMDVTRLRLYVRHDALEDNRETVERVRRQAFEWPHYPTATTVGVTSLADDDALVTADVAAFVPDEGWEAEVLAFADDG